MDTEEITASTNNEQRVIHVRHMILSNSVEPASAILYICYQARQERGLITENDVQQRWRHMRSAGESVDGRDVHPGWSGRSDSRKDPTVDIAAGYVEQTPATETHYASSSDWLVRVNFASESRPELKNQGSDYVGIVVCEWTYT